MGNGAEKGFNLAPLGSHFWEHTLWGIQGLTHRDPWVHSAPILDWRIVDPLRNRD